jgi:hypothetical protein
VTPDENEELARAVRELTGQLRRLPDDIERKLYPHRRIERMRPGWSTPERWEEKWRDRWRMRYAAVSAGSAVIAAIAAVLAFVVK